MSDKVQLSKVKIKIGDQEIKLSIEQIIELRDELNRRFIPLWPVTTWSDYDIPYYVSKYITTSIPDNT